MSMKAPTFIALILTASSALAQHSGGQSEAFEAAAQAFRQQLEGSLADLDRLREQIAQEKIPLSRELDQLEAELKSVQTQYQEQKLILENRTLDLTRLTREIENRDQEVTYLSGLLSDYGRELEARLHISELPRYQDRIEAARLAPDNANLSQEEVYETQAKLLADSIERLDEIAGGTRFQGTAVVDGLVTEGAFALVGPTAVFRSADGRAIGTAEQRLGSLEPTVFPFLDAEHAKAAAELVQTGTGRLPLDPTLGDAHKIASTDESLWEHIQKGGLVMVPIFVLAAAALLLAFGKWVSMTRLKRPSQRKIDALIGAAAQRDEGAAREKAAEIRGPVGEMLGAGVDHIREPRELIEEAMYERVLTTRLRLNGFLPFIAICAASAPLLGLLGTVTGIINTFKLITVFGSGDVKMLSGGISEALITTEFGLIVAIPSLLLHAYLSRKARAVIGDMEKAAVAFANQVSRTPLRRHPQDGGVNGEASARSLAMAPDPALVREQVSDILNEMLAPLAEESRSTELAK